MHLCNRDDVGEDTAREAAEVLRLIPGERKQWVNRAAGKGLGDEGWWLAATSQGERLSGRQSGAGSEQWPRGRAAFAGPGVTGEQWRGRQEALSEPQAKCVMKHACARRWLVLVTYQAKPPAFSQEQRIQEPSQGSSLSYHSRVASEQAEYVTTSTTRR